MFSAVIIAILAVTAQASPLRHVARGWNSTASTSVSVVNDTSLPSQLNNANNWDIKLAIQQDFPDPAIWSNGKSWYAFSTASHGVNTQVATSSDFKNWNVLAGHDALPTPGSWTLSSAPGIWAPDVFRNNKGKYVLYYSGTLAASTAHHCIGIATSDNVEGPYVDNNPNPAVCPLSAGGAIDPAHFRDNDGTRYMVYKIDGNSIGHGGDCNNGVAPIVPTPIMLQQMEADGITPVGNPVQIMTNQNSDGPLVEAPSLSRTVDGQYMLLFSSGCYTNPNYNTKYALANHVKGPYVRGGSPLWQSGSDSMLSPGGADAAHNGKHVVFHSSNSDGTRSMYTAILHINGNKVDAFH